MSSVGGYHALQKAKIDLAATCNPRWIPVLKRWSYTNGDQALAYFNNSKRVYRVLAHAEPVAANVANAAAASGPLAGQLALPEGC